MPKVRSTFNDNLTFFLLTTGLKEDEPKAAIVEFLKIVESGTGEEW